MLLLAFTRLGWGHTSRNIGFPLAIPLAPHKHLECPVWLACWLISAVPPAFQRRSFQLHFQMQRYSSQHCALRTCSIPWGSWSFTSCIWCGRWDLWMEVQLVHWSNLQSSLSWSQALQVLPTTASKHHLPHAYTNLIHCKRLVSLNIPLAGWTLKKISKALPDLVSPPCFLFTSQQWSRLAGLICRQIDQEALEKE